MNALKIIVPIYLVLFIFGGFRNIKMFLLLTGIVAMPFRTTYTLMDVGAYTGWTNGIMISLSDVSFICLFFYLLLTRKRFTGFSRRLTAPTLFMVASVLFSLANSTWARLSLFEALLLIQAFFLYYVVLTVAIESKRELRLVILGLMFSLLLQGSLGIVQYFTGRELDFFRTGTPSTELTEEGAVTRALGTIGKPNALAMYVVPLILLVTAILMRSGERLYRYIGTFALAAGGLALLLSFSRGGWMAFSLAFVVLLVVMVRGGYTKPRTLVATLSIVLLVVVIFYPQIHDRMVSEEGAAAAVDRVYLVKIAWNMIKESPFVGIGANTFMSVIQQYQRGPELTDIYLHMVHNQYLLVFAETGLVGIAAFMWLLVSCFRESWECVHSKTSGLTQAIGLSVTAGFIAISVHMMVDMYCSPLCMGMLFLFFGLCSAARKVEGGEAVVRQAVSPPQRSNMVPST